MVMLKVRQFAEAKFGKSPFLPNDSLAIILRDAGYPYIPFTKIMGDVRAFLDTQVGYYDHIVVPVPKGDGMEYYLVFFTSNYAVTAYRLQFTK